MEVILVFLVYVEFDDLDNYFIVDESLIDDGDEYFINVKINFELVEELYSFFILLDYFKFIDEWYRCFFFKKKV